MFREKIPLIKDMNPDHFRNIIFGAEDSLVSTVGVLFGLACSMEYASKQIVLTGLVLISVEALSMGAGSFLSEKGVHDISDSKKPTNDPTVDGLLMFTSYFLAGFVALLPYVFMPTCSARYLSVLLTFIALYLLGFIPTRNTKAGIRMVVVAGFAIIMGFAVAKAFGGII